MIGDFDKATVENLPGVLEVVVQPNEWVVKINDESCVNDIFNYVKTCSNVRKFDVEQASLSEIFIEKSR